MVEQRLQVRPGQFRLALLQHIQRGEVIASVAVEITASASGAQKGECSEGSFWASPPAASHLSLGVPPTQKIRLSIDLSASQKRLKSSPPSLPVS